MPPHIIRSALTYLVLAGFLAATATPALAAVAAIRTTLAQPGGPVAALVAVAVLA